MEREASGHAVVVLHAHALTLRDLDRVWEGEGGVTASAMFSVSSTVGSSAGLCDCPRRHGPGIIGSNSIGYRLLPEQKIRRRKRADFLILESIFANCVMFVDSNKETLRSSFDLQERCSLMMRTACLLVVLEVTVAKELITEAVRTRSPGLNTILITKTWCRCRLTTQSLKAAHASKVY